ncbi:desulfoferrodoxin family protein, partial [Segatella copri]|uniref:desulfoferrodoxin family protein n=1 Tax=Segatella copri TaxID=165179 RepID=UPI00345F22AF
MEQVLSSASGNRGSIYHPMRCIETIRKKSLISYHFPGIGKMIPLAKGAQREAKDVTAREYCNLHGLWKGV